MNINVAAWGRLIKNIQPSHESGHHTYSDSSSHSTYGSEGMTSPTMPGPGLLSSLTVNSSSNTPITPGKFFKIKF